MPLGLEPEGIDQGRAQSRAIAGMAADQRLEVQRALVTEAEHQLAFGGDAHAVAVAAEVAAVG
ncbi:hypothetical protein D3C72_2120410 [compost metagenome]